MCVSLWEKDFSLPAFGKLRSNIKTDVLIIGGGMAGILCARELSEAGADCVLLEAKTICSGASGGTTAKISSQHGLIYHRLYSRFGAEAARLYYQLNQKALERFAFLCRQIDCDFHREDSYIYSLEGRDILFRELEVLSRIGAKADFAETPALPFATDGAVRFPDQARFHPLKFAAAAANGLNIFEHSPVRELGHGLAKTDEGSVKAEKIVVCTHFPFINRRGLYFLKQYQSRSYAAAFSGCGKLDGMYMDCSGSGFSFRAQGEALIIGGGAHRTGKPTVGWDRIAALAAAHYPSSRELCRWAAQDCMSLDGLPYIGPYSLGSRNLFVATGFNKWGMSLSMAAAMVLSRLITDGGSAYARLFSPSRSMLRPQLALNAFEAASGLLSFTEKRCPHMGCGLKWNGAEHSWDCPCHGSRFDEKGKLLDNPAKDNLKK